ncbi:FAD-dependent monooxygenase [Sphingosinicella sp. CPCC 101087]|uniref:FAD-dependent monooxygenase n=1 Tax=Sphingosinicella sp. CPCC 101087 TaxID=2497754 RepID=UPI00101D4E4F|nr:FAD-dependent monooxygenase [Sphingosinicella sp. CPCC 101087]
MDIRPASVLIAGGGPVGLGLAIELGQRGTRTLVVERNPQVHRVPKGQNLTQRSMEHFRAWGCESELRAARPIPPEYGIGGLTAYGTLLGQYHYDWLQRELVRPFYATDNERLPQYETERVLRERAAQLEAVEILYGWTASDAEQNGDGVRLRVRREEDGEAHWLTADYLVGCDGSRSAVRESAGIGQTVLDHDKRMVLLVLRSQQLHELLGRFAGKSFFNILPPRLQGYWQFLGRVDLGTRWFFHAPVPPQAAHEDFDFAACLHEAVGAPFDFELEHIGFWDLRFANAEAYSSGRVFIAGDAAHSHPPYGGYGINLGFEDARNLGWKLAATIEGWGGPSLLDSYGEERRAIFASTATDFINRLINDDRRFLEAFDPEVDRAAFEQEWARRAGGARTDVGAYAPHYSGSPVVWSAQGSKSDAKGGHDFRARAGHHLAPLPSSGETTTLDSLGSGFTLLNVDGDPQWIDAFAAAASSLGIPLDIADLGEAGSSYRAAMILVRPDGFVAWAADGRIEEPVEVLLRATGGGSANASSARAA